jgi:DNA polymerase III delta prime subunit
MINKKHTLWCEKYRPSTVKEYVFHDPLQEATIMQMIANKSIPQLLFSGVQGSGKTALARILITAMGVDESDVLTINASDNRGIDTFRDTIKNFATTMALGTFKIVHLEESDRLTIDAQSALKGFMEDVSDHVRFIFTCNHVSKIIPPIRSRCQEFYFKASDQNDIAEYLISILSAEQAKFDLDLLDQYITFAYPDIRKMVNLLQQNTVGGILQPLKLDGEVGDYKFKLIDLLEKDKWGDARKLICASVTSDEWEGLYRFLYENISKSTKFRDTNKWEEAVLVIAESLYKNSISADPEINAAACFIKLGQI